MPETLISKVEVSGQCLDISRRYLDVSRRCLDISRCYLDVSRGCLDISRGCLDISRGCLVVSRLGVGCSRWSLDALRFSHRNFRLAFGRSNMCLDVSSDARTLSARGWTCQEMNEEWSEIKRPSDQHKILPQGLGCCGSGTVLGLG